jgi:hypothetical protein
MPAFALLRTRAVLTVNLHRSVERSPTTLLYRRIHGFGALLSPVTLSAPDHSTSELLRTLSRMAASKPTSWLSRQSDHLSHYSSDLGALAGDLGCFPLDDESSHPPSHYAADLVAFTVWLGSVSALPPRPSSSLPPRAHTLRAEPQSISGRTSYLRVRLAFHPYPQLIPQFCNTGEFAPPVRFTGPSRWPWVAHPVSGLLRPTGAPSSDSLSLRLHPCTGHRLAARSNSPAHSSIGTRSPVPCGLRHRLAPHGIGLSLTVGKRVQ